MSEPAFRRFVEAQLTWDRAMAEVLAREAKRSDRPLVVGIIGQGHLENRWGVPHQLASLDVHDAGVLLPWRRERCAAITPDLADAVFLLDDDRESAPEGPRLGVTVTPHRDGVQVLEVTEGGVADVAGLAANDVILAVGGANVLTAQDLTLVIQKQMSGALVPITVRRGNEPLRLVARFPDAPAQ